jgi:hypothetical protein
MPIWFISFRLSWSRVLRARHGIRLRMGSRICVTLATTPRIRHGHSGHGRLGNTLDGSLKRGIELVIGLMHGQPLEQRP